ncbi:MAG: DUF5667 domain-containing protein [Patescibacteria group bacterium]|nr:DUF5667 domain-containing protein [Patescibacteria group bacterium]MCL5261841.1 DUF5667 domain-containing protein [Patescibacteria group bacterium]
MRNKLLLIAFLGIILISGNALAQTTTTATDTTTAAPTAEADSGLLPSSPFYFLKEWRRSLQRAFSFGAEAKANTELKIAEEKAAEVKAVDQTEPQNVTALTKALANYQASQERLKAHFEALKNTSNNPNIDKLIQKFTDAAAKHEDLFKSLIQKAGEAKDIKEAVSSSQSAIEDAAAVAATKSQAAAQAVEKIQERLRLSAGTPGEYCNRISAKVAELDSLYQEKKISDTAYNLQRPILLKMMTGCPVIPTTPAVAPAAVPTTTNQTVPENQLPQAPTTDSISATSAAPTASDIVNAVKNILPTLKTQNLNAVTPHSSSADSARGKAQPAAKVNPTANSNAAVSH